MGKQGELRLILLGSEGEPLKDTVDIELEHRRLSDYQTVRDVDGSNPIEISGLYQVPEGLYKILVQPRSHRSVAQFVNIKSSGVTEVEISFRPKCGDKEVGYTPRIIVRFHDFVELPYQDGVEPEIEELQIGPWNRLEAQFPGITLNRLFSSLPAERLKELMSKAMEMDPSYHRSDLLSYFVVECPPGVLPDVLAKAFAEWDTVQTAYFDPPGSEPLVDPVDDPRFGNQGYLDPAPDGIDAEFVWPRSGGLGFTGGDGQGIRVIDLERGWTLNHEDISAQGATLLHGSIRDGSRAHGTAVLGEICAVDNSRGCVGITPNVASVDVVSYWFSTRSSAILAAINNLSFGDVLLLEAQLNITGWSAMPIEVLDAEYDAIRLATALGIVVVEAAGNGSNDLDTYTNGIGDAIFNRTAPGFRDSGAIMVGAASSAAPHSRLGFSNFGSRIDCYAWGQNVDTLSSTSTGSTTSYTSTFDGTSSASPIIVGGVVATQGIAESSLGYRFSPRQVRDILSNPATGTASASPATDRIGSMPNLRAIVEDDVLNLAPDVYVRDFVGDVGDPHSAAISASPDVILRQATEANPQTSFGQGSGTENLNSLGAQAEAGQDNYLYVRVRNRGGSAATNVAATVYWSPPSTLMTPNLWTLIGSTTIPNVPTGDVLTVSDALVWPSAAIPATGHYCFVGLIGTPGDPAPGPADFLNWGNFRRFIRENNNVTWRNFNVVDNEPDLELEPRGFVVLPFVVPGAPDRARPMALEVVARLPEGAQLALQAPQHFVDVLAGRSPYFRFDKATGLVEVPLNPQGRRSLGPASLRAESKTKVRLLVRIPEEARKNDYQVYIRQLFEGEEVGRLSWRLAPKGWRDPCDPRPIS